MIIVRDHQGSIGLVLDMLTASPSTGASSNDSGKLKCRIVPKNHRPGSPSKHYQSKSYNPSAIAFAHPRPYYTHRSTTKPLFSPPLRPHRLFYSRPETLNNLAISPAALFTLSLTPVVYLSRFHASAPSQHGCGDWLAMPSNVDAQSVCK